MNKLKQHIIEKCPYFLSYNIVKYILVVALSDEDHLDRTWFDQIVLVVVVVFVGTAAAEGETGQSFVDHVVVVRRNPFQCLSWHSIGWRFVDPWTNLDRYCLVDQDLDALRTEY